MASQPLTTRLYLVRHGLVADEWHGRLYGDLDVPLSGVGREQAERAAARLRSIDLNAVASSDLARARFGAEAIARGRSLEVRALPELREISRGDWAGQSIETFEREHPGELAGWFQDPDNRRPPGGESLRDLRARVLPSLSCLASDNVGGSVAIVAHGWVIRSVVAVALGLDPTQLRQIHVPPAAVACIDWPSEQAGSEAVAWDERRDEPQRERPYLVGVHLDEAPPAARGWYRAPG